MANLEPEVQIKLLEISKEWAEQTADYAGPNPKNPISYPKEFDTIYKQLVKTTAEK